MINGFTLQENRCIYFFLIVILFINFRGATHSTLILIDLTGQKFGSWEETGLNCLLKGIEATADFICEWIRAVIREYSVNNLASVLNLPLYGLVSIFIK